VLIDDDLIEMDESDVPRLDRLSVSVVTARSDMALLGKQIADHEYDHVIVLGYRGELTAAEGDARTLLTMLLLQRSATTAGRGLGRVVAEILDSRDVELAQATGADDFIVSDALSSYMMAQLAENPELDAVFTDLFDAAVPVFLPPVDRGVYHHADRAALPGAGILFEIPRMDRPVGAAIGAERGPVGEGTTGELAVAPELPQGCPRPRSAMLLKRLVASRARAASSKTCVPSTLVRMNSRKPWILRSTWLSAAKLTMASTP
jgi:hypothetical protein